MNTKKPLASLSLDLDNKWSYLKTHGDPGWESFPSYLGVVVPRVLDFLGRHRLTITFFVVGQDAALAENREALRAIADAGHEIGNHSFKHEPWLHLYSEQEAESELAMAEESIERATGQRPVGFRGPGFSVSPTILRILARRGYQYDASTFPTFIGPLARAYYFMTSRLPAEEKRRRKLLFGTFREGFRPLKPYRWQTESGPLLEIPVTTMPLVRLPIHMSYLLYLGSFAPDLALLYFRSALRLCRITGTPPSLLLHPLDFLGCDDTQELSFFPAMRLPSEQKIALVDRAIRLLTKNHNIVALRRYTEEDAGTSTLPV
jgi:peptidoglycan-N-acetylglucosamine deacetylase